VKVDFMKAVVDGHRKGRGVGSGILALVLAACSGGAATPGAGSCPAASPLEEADGGPLTSFTPYTASFDCFHSWNTAPAAAQDDAGDGLHGVGPLWVYWNQSPPHGATSFPVGTIIVKETQEPDVTQRIIFAMVKRGLDEGVEYNTGGATGWEWWSLQNNSDGSVNMLWRGVVAPAGETYANQTIGDCNGCHAAASANDSVWDEALQLPNF
jgi:hypothetical protein